MNRILVVDDEHEIADLIELYLEHEDYQVFKANNGEDGLRYVETEQIDLAILDVMLPDISGFTMCKKIREKYSFPIILLTAKLEETDKITGLTFGADDYVTKPFKPLELVARVKAQLRRYTKYNSDSAAIENVYVCGGLVVDVGTHECTLDGETLPLTPTEFTILQLLCQKRGSVVSSEELFHGVWGNECFNKANNTVTTHIRHLREKLKDSVEHPQYIKTLWGVGYKIDK